MRDAPALFVYGTLRFPEVVVALLGRRPTMVPAAVAGWRAAALRDRTYPGLVPAGRGEVCEGRCLLGLTRAERELLDLFEGDSYEADAVTLVGGGPAVAYLWRGGGGQADVRAVNWDIADFASLHLSEFVQHCRQWRGRVA